MVVFAACDEAGTDDVIDVVEGDADDASSSDGGVDAADDVTQTDADSPETHDGADAAEPDDTLQPDADVIEPDADWLDEFEPAWVPRGQLAARHPEVVERLSIWQQVVETGERPTAGRLAAWGVGNGRIFGLLGMSRPFGTIHGVEGPTYDRGDRFFSDHAIELGGADGEAWELGQERVLMSLRAPVVITESNYGDWRVLSWVFAPWAVEGVSPACIVRLIEIECRLDECAGEPHLVASGVLADVDASGGELVEEVDLRVMRTAIAGAGVTAEGNALRARVEPGEVYTVTHCTAFSGQPLDVIADGQEALEQTRLAWRAWADETVQVELDHPGLEDLIEGMKFTLRLQRSAQGASSPMSSYTRSWPRDNVGPTLALLALGAHDDVRDLLDYLYAAAIEHGDFKNSYRADIDIATVGDAPDWSALGPLPRRESAETPSYLVRMIAAYVAATGDLEPFRRDRGYIERALFAQAIDDDGLLPFTGDETFRAAMNAAFGYDLETAHHELSFSLGSSLLWLGAARDARRLAAEAGFEGLIEAIDAIEPNVRAGLARYALDGGCLSALIERASGEPFAQVFEDVSLTPVWSGAHDRDDPGAIDAIACAFEALRTSAGVAQSPMHERYDLSGPVVFGTRLGVFTGMAPGYTLSALTDIGHAEAFDAFVHAVRALDASGNAQEYQIADDFSGLSLIYDATGETGDYTAKYRPWEGGIVVAAIIQYLTGYSADVPGGRISLRPHLPAPMNHSRWSGLRFGDARLDLRIERDAAGVVAIEVDALEGDAGVLAWSVRLDGARADRVNAPEGATLSEGSNAAGAHWVDVSFGATAGWSLTVAPASAM